MFNHDEYIFQASINWEMCLLAFCWRQGSQNQSKPVSELCINNPTQKCSCKKKTSHYSLLALFAVSEPLEVV